MTRIQPDAMSPGQESEVESPEGNGSNPPLISISTLLKQSDSAGADDTTKRLSQWVKEADVDGDMKISLKELLNIGKQKLQDDAKHKKVVKYWSGVSLVLLVFTAILVLAFAGITFVVVDQTKAVRSTEGRMFAGLGGTGQTVDGFEQVTVTIGYATGSVEVSHSSSSQDRKLLEWEGQPPVAGLPCSQGIQHLKDLNAGITTGRLKVTDPATGEMMILMVDSDTYSDGLGDKPAYIWATPSSGGVFGERYALDFDGSGLNAESDPQSVDDSCTLPIFQDLTTELAGGGNATDGGSRRRHLLSAADGGIGGSGVQRRVAVSLHRNLPDGRRILREEHPHMPPDKATSRMPRAMDCEVAHDIFWHHRTGHDNVLVDIAMPGLAMPRLSATLSHLEVSPRNGSAILRGVASFRAATLRIERRAFSLHCPADFLDSDGRSVAADPASLMPPAMEDTGHEDQLPCSCFVAEESPQPRQRSYEVNGADDEHAARRSLQSSDCESRCRSRRYDRCYEWRDECFVPCHEAADNGEYNGPDGWHFCKDNCNRDLDYCTRNIDDDCREDCREELCFAAGSLVMAQRPGYDNQPHLMPMEELSPGDLVLSVDATTGRPVMENVYVIAHKDLKTTTMFYHLSTACSGVSLALTPTHLLFVSTDGSGGFASAALVTAQDVLIGDTVWALSPGDPAPRPCAVADVSIRQSSGIINVLSMSGRLVVDGTVASSFVGPHADLWGLFPSPEEGRHTPLLQHLAAPLRWLYWACPSCVEALHVDEGFAVFILARKVEVWLSLLRGRNKPVQVDVTKSSTKAHAAGLTEDQHASCPAADLHMYKPVIKTNA